MGRKESNQTNKTISLKIGYTCRTPHAYVGQDEQNKRGHGLGSLTCERMFTLKYKSHSPTLKSILAITHTFLAQGA